MSELQTAVEITEGQMDLFTGEVVETAPAEEVTLEVIIRNLTRTVFKGAATTTAYQIHNVVNGVFEVMGIDKKIPPQMMYNYNKNGMITGTKGQKSFTEDEVVRFVHKHVSRRLAGK